MCSQNCTKRNFLSTYASVDIFRLFQTEEDRNEDENLYTHLNRHSFLLPRHLDVPEDLCDTTAWSSAASGFYQLGISFINFFRTLGHQQ